MVRYAIVYGKRDTADRFLPMGEFYLRGAGIERAKELFKSLPQVTDSGDFVFRVSERYYDKHLEQDMHYQKSEFTIECGQSGFNIILDHLMGIVQ
jgi:hypothetical protein